MARPRLLAALLALVVGFTPVASAADLSPLVLRYLQLQVPARLETTDKQTGFRIYTYTKPEAALGVNALMMLRHPTDSGAWAITLPMVTLPPGDYVGTTRLKLLGTDALGSAVHLIEAGPLKGALLFVLDVGTVRPVRSLTLTTYRLLELTDPKTAAWVRERNR